MISLIIGLILVGGAAALCFFPEKLRGIVPDQLLPKRGDSEPIDLAFRSNFTTHKDPSDPLYTSFVLIVHFGAGAAELAAQLDWMFAHAYADRVAGMMQSMLYHEKDIIACTNYGDVTPSFIKAQGFFFEQDADLCGTFVSEIDRGPVTVPEVFSQTENVVLCLNMVYEGEVLALEQDLDSITKLSTALSTIYSLAQNERILAANIYKLPAHPHHHLTNDQVLLNFPALKPV